MVQQPKIWLATVLSSFIWTLKMRGHSTIRNLGHSPILEFNLITKTSPPLLRAGWQFGDGFEVMAASLTPSHGGKGGAVEKTSVDSRLDCQLTIDSSTQLPWLPPAPLMVKAREPILRISQTV